VYVVAYRTVGGLIHPSNLRIQEDFPPGREANISVPSLPRTRQVDSKNLIRAPYFYKIYFNSIARSTDRPCGLVAKVPDSRYRGPSSIAGATREVVGLERGRLRIASTIEELLGRSSGSSLEIEITAVGIFNLYPQKLALTLQTSGCLSVGIVRSRTQAAEFS
jgi:hypothetical protein